MGKKPTTASLPGPQPMRREAHSQQQHVGLWLITHGNHRAQEGYGCASMGLSAHAGKDQLEHIQSSPVFSAPASFRPLYSFWSPCLKMKVGVIRVCPGQAMGGELASFLFSSLSVHCTAGFGSFRDYRVPSCVGACLMNFWNESSEQTRTEISLSTLQYSRSAVSSYLAELDLSL